MTNYRFTIREKIANSVVESIRSAPIGHPDHPGLMSRSARVGHSGNGVSEIVVEFPEPQPTIPELIKAWHAEPTPNSRSALWKAIMEYGEDSWEYHRSFTMDGLTYYASTGGCLVVK